MGLHFRRSFFFLSLERANHRASERGWLLRMVFGVFPWEASFSSFSWVDIWGIRYLHFSNDHDFEMAFTLLFFLSVLWLSSPNTGSP